MANKHYIFDEQTATYVPSKKNHKRTLLFLVPSFLLLLGAGVYLGKLIPEEKNAMETQKEKELLMVKNQYEKLQDELEKIEGSLNAVENKDENIYRTFFQMDTLSEEERNPGMGGSERYSQYKDYEMGNMIIKVSEKADVLRARLKAQEKSLEEIQALAGTKSKKLLHIPAIQPITNKDLTRLASGFGMRRHPILRTSRMHEGLDFTSPRGTPIYATANGTISSAGVKGGYGNCVEINHENGYETLYAHMSKMNVRAGQKVVRGQVIGYVGSTGLSSGPHLHYELKKDGVKIDPISYFYNDINANQYKKLKEVAELSEVSWD